MKKIFYLAVMVFLGSGAALLTLTSRSGADRAFEQGDAPHFLSLAQSLSTGHGYAHPAGLWPGRPAYDRMPVWPVLLSLGLRIAPYAQVEAVSRYTNAVCLAFAGSLFVLVALRLGASASTSVLAGFMVAFAPPLLYLSMEGMSEISFVLLLGAGLYFFLTENLRCVGALLLGLAALCRSNFILVPFIAATLLILSAQGRRWLFSSGRTKGAALAFGLSILPALIWAGRNYHLTGRFPVLSSMQGETLYGANNEVVSHQLKNWGYWVFPNDIPGETPKRALARLLPNDLALNDYYDAKARAWIRTHRRELPRLVLGKLVRAYVPIPWSTQTPAFVAFGYRWALYLSFFALWPYWRGRMGTPYALVFVSMAFVQLLTTVVYYGVFRFTFCFSEVLLIPCIAVGLDQLRRRFTSSSAVPVR